MAFSMMSGNGNIHNREAIALHGRLLSDELINETGRCNEIVAPPGTGCLPYRRAMEEVGAVK